MIAVDTNILVYAHRADSPHHQAAAAAIKRLAEGGAPWAIPWACVHEFLSVSTNLRIFRPPSPPEAAIQQVEIWMECPTLRLLGEAKFYLLKLTVFDPVTPTVSVATIVSVWLPEASELTFLSLIHI